MASRTWIGGHGPEISQCRCRSESQATRSVWDHAIRRDCFGDLVRNREETVREPAGHREHESRPQPPSTATLAGDVIAVLGVNETGFPMASCRRCRCIRVRRPGEYGRSGVELPHRLANRQYQSRSEPLSLVEADHGDPESLHLWSQQAGPLETENAHLVVRSVGFREQAQGRSAPVRRSPAT